MGDDLDVTGILDPDITKKGADITEADIDFELDEVVGDDFGNGLDGDFLDLDALDTEGKADGQALSKPEAEPGVLDLDLVDKVDPVDDDDFDFDLDEDLGAVDGLDDLDAPGFEDDVDFDLDDPAGPGVPAAAAMPPDREDDVDFDLDDMITSEDVESAMPAQEEPDLEFDEMLRASETAKSDHVEDFDLDSILTENGSVEEPGRVLDAGVGAMEDVEKDLDFDLEERVESVPEPPADLVGASEPGADFDFGADGKPDDPPAEAGSPVSDLPEDVELVAPESPAVDMERLEAVVELTVRRTVTEVLERMLPGLIEESVGRELENILKELEESD